MAYKQARSSLLLLIRTNEIKKDSNLIMVYKSKKHFGLYKILIVSDKNNKRINNLTTKMYFYYPQKTF